MFRQIIELQRSYSSLDAPHSEILNYYLGKLGEIPLPAELNPMSLTSPLLLKDALIRVIDESNNSSAYVVQRQVIESKAFEKFLVHYFQNSTLPVVRVVDQIIAIAAEDSMYKNGTQLISLLQVLKANIDTPMSAYALAKELGITAKNYKTKLGILVRKIDDYLEKLDASDICFVQLRGNDDLCTTITLRRVAYFES